MSRFLLGWLATLAAVAFLTLRAGRDPPADFVLNNDDEPHSLDPAIAAWTHDIRAATGLFEGLTRLDPQTLRPQPAAAHRVDESEDRKVYTFHLREDLRWAKFVPGTGPVDVGAVTAGDFIFAWKRVLDPGAESEYYNLMFVIQGAEDYYKKSQEYGEAKTAGDRARLKADLDAAWDKVGVQALDDLTLRVELIAPTAYFLDLTAFVTFYPVHRPTVGTGGTDSNESQAWTLRPETFVGNGPFLLAERSIQRRLRFVKNPHYWDAASVKSNVIDLLPIKNQTTAMLAYEGGYVDLVPTVDERPARAIKRRAEAGGATRTDLHLTPAFGTYFYRFNCKSEIPHPDTGRNVPNPLADPRVRRALCLAVDRRKLAEELMALGQKPMGAFVPPEVIAGYPGFPFDDARDHDPAKARALLDEAGLTDRSRVVPLVILYNEDESHTKVAMFVRDAWISQLGLDVRVHAMEFKTFSQMVNSISFVVSRSGWFGDYMDPLTFLDMFESSNGHNQTGFKNEEYDKLIKAAQIEPDRKLRRETLEKAEKMLCFEQAPIMPLFRYVDRAMSRGTVRGYYPNARGQIDVKHLYKVKE